MHHNDNMSRTVMVWGSSYTGDFYMRLERDMVSDLVCFSFKVIFTSHAIIDQICLNGTFIKKKVMVHLGPTKKSSLNAE